MARSTWGSLGIAELMEEATAEDRSGSAVRSLFIYYKLDSALPNFHVGLTQVVAVASWYPWWIRRRRTHNESAHPIFHCKYRSYSLRRMLRNSSFPKPRRSIPGPRQVKVNVGGSFHSDCHAGSVGAILRGYVGKYIVASIFFSSDQCNKWIDGDERRFSACKPPKMQ
jgi:hypothetical protein